jgi:hypothetical protein
LACVLAVLKILERRDFKKKIFMVAKVEALLQFLDCALA